MAHNIKKKGKNKNLLSASTPITPKVFTPFKTPLKYTALNKAYTMTNYL